MTSLLSECIALGFVVVLGSLASGAGVGGGALYIPLFVILLSPQKLAIPLSKACAFGASVAMYIVNCRKRRPKPNGFGEMPLIDYRMAVLLEPFTLLGTMVGVRLNKLLPFPIVATMMSIIMTMIAIKTFHRAIAVHRKEQVEAGESKTAYSKLDDGAAVFENETEPKDVKPEPVDDAQFPLAPLLTMFVYWILGVVPSILVSGRFGNVQCMSIGYILIMFSSMALLLLFATINALMVIRKSNRLDPALLSNDEGNVHWTAKSISYFSSVSFAAGVFSALVGVGGSTIKGPFLAHVTAPDIASSTAGFMLLSTCSASMFQFMLLDMLDLRIATAFFGAGFAAAYFGSRVWGLIVKAWNKRSIIVFLLASYVSLATLAMTTLSVYEIYSTSSLTKVDSIC